MSLLGEPTGEVAGILHQNHLYYIARGPWKFRGYRKPRTVIETGPDASGGAEAVEVCGGTCAICSSPIVGIAEFISAGGEVITLGLDCAQTFAKHIGNAPALALKAAATKQRKADREAANVRRGERWVAAHGETWATLEAMKAREGFPGTFATSLAAQIRRGNMPSAKQIALLERLAKG